MYRNYNGFLKGVGSSGVGVCGLVVDCLRGLYLIPLRSGLISYAFKRVGLSAPLFYKLPLTKYQPNPHNSNLYYNIM